MLHPSYSDLMAVANSDVEPGEQPVVQSRYSIVLATAKRARQIISGQEPLVKAKTKDIRPLSIAVEELHDSKIKILTDEEAEEAWEVRMRQVEEVKAARELEKARIAEEEEKKAAEEAAKKELEKETSDDEDAVQATADTEDTVEEQDTENLVAAGDEEEVTEEDTEE
jgi:DNA-directed RNA polymerase subunit omega